MFFVTTIFKPLYCPPFLQIGLIKKNGFITFLSLDDIKLLDNEIQDTKETKWINIDIDSDSILSLKKNNISFYLLDELLDKTQKNPECIIDPQIQQFFTNTCIDKISNTILPFKNQHQPIITYIVLTKSIYAFSLKIGLLRSPPESFMGPYYYFNCYRPFLQEENKEHKEHKEQNIVVKVALFLGKYHVIPFCKKNFNSKKKKDENLFEHFDTIYAFNPLTQTPYWVVKSNTQFQLFI
jgi:hypothetical protein